MSLTTREQDFVEMLRESQPFLVRLARQYGGTQDWPDLLQEMHLQLWRSYGQFDGRAKRSTWIFRVSLNTAIGHLRRRPMAHQSLEGLPEQGDVGAPIDPIDVLSAFLSRLDPIQRAVLLLDLEGLEREQMTK